MGRTRTQLRQAVAQQTGLPFISGTADSGGSTTTLKDAPLLRFRDDELIGFYIYLSSGSPTYTNLTITDFVNSTFLATFRPTLGAAPDTLTYEILPFPGDAIHTAIDEAILMLYDAGVLVRKLWIKAVAGSPIYNAFGEYWTSSTALHGWSNTATVSRQTGAAVHFITEEATRLSGNGLLDLDVTWRRFLADCAGNSVIFRAWVNTGTTSNGRISVVASDATTSSSYHSGDSTWELLSTAAVAIPDGDMNWTVRFQRVSANVDFGGCWIEGGNYPDLHPIPSVLMPDGPDQILVSPLSIDETNLKATVIPESARPFSAWDYMTYKEQAVDVEMGVIRWIKKPPAGKLLWIVGNGPLSLPTADTDVVECNQMEGLLIAKVAAVRLLEANMIRQAISTQEKWARTIDSLKADIAMLSRGAGSKSDVASLGPNW